MLGTYLAGQPLSASGLAPQQFARLNMPVLEKLLPASTHGSLHQWYHTQRGAQIIVDTSAQVGDASARRYLSNLYQRGFLVRQIAGSAGQAPQYRMGHFQADPATYVPVPALLSAKLTDAYPALTKGSGYLVEPAWPAPRSAQANNMMRLAAAIDSEHKPSAIAQQVGRLQQVYSGLRPLNQPKDLLDALVSGTELRQSTVNSSSKASERPQQAGKSSSERDIETDSLLDMLDRQTGQCNQKGFLDVLGESADVVRPKKKRIGQDDRHRSRLK